MHAVLRVEQCYVLGVTLQPLKHRMPELACANHGRKLAIVSNENETPRAKDQSEGERLGQLAGLVDDCHLEGSRAKVWNRRCAMSRGCNDGCCLKRVSNSAHTAGFAGEVLREEVRRISGQLRDKIGRI